MIVEQTTFTAHCKIAIDGQAMSLTLLKSAILDLKFEKQAKSVRENLIVDGASRILIGFKG